MSNCFTKLVSDIVRLQWDAYDNVREAIADEAMEFGIPEAKIPELPRPSFISYGFRVIAARRKKISWMRSERMVFP
jgi:hypothetical protein